MLRILSAVLLLTSAVVIGQRPFFAGFRPIGYPDTPNRTTTAAPLGNRFGEGTTEKLPIEANGDKDLVDRLSKLPIDQQPFWLLNWQALDENRKNPQTYPQKPNVFAEQNFQNSDFNAGISKSGTPNFNNGVSNSNNVAPNLNNGADNFNSGAANFNNGPASLNSAAANFNNGPASLNSAAANFNNGAANLNAGAANFHNGAANFNSGAATFNNGAANLKTGAANSNIGAANLKSEATNLNNGVTNLNTGSSNSNVDLSNSNFKTNNGVPIPIPHAASSVNTGHKQEVNSASNSGVSSLNSNAKVPNVGNRFGDIATGSNANTHFKYSYQNFHSNEEYYAQSYTNTERQFYFSK